jgi:polyphenol oxidase
MDAPELLSSKVLTSIGVPHAFSTRRGGVSRGMFESLNFGNPGDLAPAERDPPANIARNWELLAMALDARCAANCRSRTIMQVHQVHGATVDVIQRDRTSAEREGADPKADAIVTNDPRVLAAVRVADCAPVLLASADGSIVASVHAGWRGVVGGAATAALNEMRSLGASEVVACIGPCISVEAFEVGEEVAAEFERAFPADANKVIRRRTGMKPHVDIKRALTLQLMQAGVATVETLPICTAAESGPSGACFSHRGHAGRTGRMVGVIGPAGV